MLELVPTVSSEITHRKGVRMVSKVDRMLKKPEVQSYMIAYHAYLDGELGLAELREIESRLLEAGHSRELLALAREHVKEGRIRGRGAHEAAAAC